MQEDPGLRKASHIGLWILGLGLLGWTVYSAFHGSIENNRYAPGSASYSINNTYHPLSSLIPCGAFFRISTNPMEKPKIDTKTIVTK